MLLKIGERPEHGFDEPLGLLSDCHRRIEHFLATIAAITDQRQGDELSASERGQLHRALAYFATAAPRHTADEEESLFPRLESSLNDAATTTLELVRRLERDHDEVETHQNSVDRLGQKWLADNRLAVDDVRELRHHLARLFIIYQAHIAAEDHELFPAAARILSADDIQAIGREMAGRRAVR